MIYLLLAVGSMCGIIYVRKLAQEVKWGWASLLLVQLYSAALGISQTSLGSFHLDINDAVIICLLIAGVVRSLRRIREGSTAQTLLMFYIGFFVFSLLRGIASNGVFAAGNEARGLVAPVVAMLYFFTTPTDEADVRTMVRLYLYYAAALITVALVAYAGAPIGYHAAGNLDAANGSNDRLIGATYAGAVALAFLFASGWDSYRMASKFVRWMLPVSLAMVIILRHRTVWAMLGVAAISMVFVDSRLWKKFLPLAMLGVVLAIGLGALIYSSETGGFSSTIEDSASDSGTWEWRVESWRQLLYDQDQTIATAIWGNSFGNGFYRFDTTSGQYQNLPPHSEYVTQYLRVGLAGTVILFMFIVRPFTLFLRLQRNDPIQVYPSASTWPLLLVSILTFGVTYSIPVDMWAIVAMANAIAWRQSQKLCVVSPASLLHEPTQMIDRRARATSTSFT